MAEFRLTINGSERVVHAPADMPLLWVLRDLVGLRGTKYGCGVGVCGACTVLRDGEPIRSCQTTAAEADGGRFTTIEGLSKDGTHRCQRAWIDEDVSQCGYCQSGMILAAVSLLQNNARPDDAAIDEALGGHVCRCGSYPRIRRAIHSASRSGGER